MPSTAFIACSKTKKSAPCTARTLYQGALFKKALAYCERHFEHVYILSAKYGIVDLDQVIAPYEQTLNTMSKQNRQIWVTTVLEQARKKGIDLSAASFFTGERYHEYFNGDKPLLHLSLGNQLKWFNSRLKVSAQGGFGL